jgi:hypothetical protein
VRATHRRGCKNVKKRAWLLNRLFSGGNYTKFFFIVYSMPVVKNEVFIKVINFLKE